MSNNSNNCYRQLDKTGTNPKVGTVGYFEKNNQSQKLTVVPSYGGVGYSWVNSGYGQPNDSCAGYMTLDNYGTASQCRPCGN